VADTLVPAEYILTHAAYLPVLSHLLGIHLSGDKPLWLREGLSSGRVAHFALLPSFSRRL